MMFKRVIAKRENKKKILKSISNKYKTKKKKERCFFFCNIIFIKNFIKNNIRKKPYYC